MGKSLLGISMDVVNGIWNVGTEAYNVVKDEVNDAIDTEAKIRTKKFLENKPYNAEEFQRIYAQEREKVQKEAKELALKGGLLALGAGLIF